MTARVNAEHHDPGTAESARGRAGCCGRARARRRAAARPWNAAWSEGLPLILGAWAIAWLVGFTMLWLIDGLSPAFRMPLPLAVVAFVVLMAGALIVSVVVGVRMGRGIRAGAASAWTGAVYGLTWPLGFAAIVVLGNALVTQRHATGAVQHLLPDGLDHLRRRDVRRRRRHLAAEALGRGSVSSWSRWRASRRSSATRAHYLFFAARRGRRLGPRDDLQRRVDPARSSRRGELESAMTDLDPVIHCSGEAADHRGTGDARRATRASRSAASGPARA